MGTIFYVGCRDCKVYRDLGKFYTAHTKCDNRKEAIGFSVDIEKKDSFRAALLISFMAQHEGHNCTFFNEMAWSSTSILSDFMDSMDGVKKDFDFWKEDTL